MYISIGTEYVVPCSIYIAYKEFKDKKVHVHCI